MKKLLLSLSLLCGITASAETSTPMGFTDDLDGALARAKESGKLVYVCFSGSDWCHWCVKLEEEVFSDDSFAKSLTNEYELVFIDSPNDSSRLSESAKVKNPELTKKFKIRGFPSMVILDGKDGSEITRGGAYRQGGAEKYVAMLKEISADPAKLRRGVELEAQWVRPLRKNYEKIMTELNVECGKVLDEEMLKPGNEGKPREAFYPATKPVVKSFMPRFKALQKLAEKKSEEAPEEIAAAVKAFADNLRLWIMKVEEDL